VKSPRARGLALCLSIATMAVALAPAFSVSAVGTGNEGCTPGYWKNHAEAWDEYATTQKVGPIFGAALPQANDTFMTALGYPGGSGVDGARRILLRAAVAATLNAAEDDLGYPLRRYQGPPEPNGFIPVVSSLLAGSDRGAILAYASYLDGLNNSGCPLN
jgi:hypothetical protein